MLGLVSDPLIYHFEANFFSFILLQIKSRGSHARSDVKDVRSKIAATYGFTLSNKTSTIRRNAKKADVLLEGNAFHYKVKFLCCLLRFHFI